MDATVSVTSTGTGERAFRVNVFQDAPEWQAAGRSLSDLGSAEVLQILQALGISVADSGQLLESALATPLAPGRTRLRLTPEQQHYIEVTFPPQ